MTDKNPMPAVYDALNWPTGLRPPVVLPTIPGTYADKAGFQWTLSKLGVFRFAGEIQTANVIEEYAPFTRLRPESEVAAEVLAEVRGMFGHGALMLNEVNAIAARWAAK